MQFEAVTDHEKTCSCARCVAARGPENNPRYEGAVAYLTKPIKYISPEAWQSMIDAYHLAAEKHGLGKLNAYVCNTCKKVLFTIDRDPGVTPAFRVCDSTKCRFLRVTQLLAGGMACTLVSSFYNLPRGTSPQLATHEYYRPSYDFYRSITDPASADHVAEGGLLFRKIGDIFPEGYEYMTGKKPEL